MHRSSKIIARFVTSLAFVAFCALAGSRLQAQANRSHITGIDHVTLYVSDIAKSQNFYAHILGLTPGCPDYNGPEICYLVRPSNARILLKRAPDEVKKDPHNSWLAEIGFTTDAASQLRSFLIAHALKPEPIQKSSNGAQYFRVLDPEGNPIAFVQRPPLKNQDAPSSKQIGSHLIHAGFVVKDREAENRFYVELLGFRLYWYGGFKDDGVDWYELQVPDGPDWIEYMLNIPADADHKELGVQNHFSFGVKDVHAAAAELRARGLASFDGPEVGRDGKDSLDAYDPDGTRVEIMEFKPVQKPCCHAYSADHPTP